MRTMAAIILWREKFPNSEIVRFGNAFSLNFVPPFQAKTCRDSVLATRREIKAWGGTVLAHDHSIAPESFLCHVGIRSHVTCCRVTCVTYSV
jgi:hypothetical protein